MLVLPRRLDERSVELMREFGTQRSSVDEVRSGLFGKLDA